MTRLRLPTLLLALALVGCDSEMHMTANPANAPLSGSSAVTATVAPNATGGETVTITTPSQLPQAFQSATKLQAAFNGTLVDVSRTSGGFYTFNVPPTAKLTQSGASGAETVTLIANSTTSQILTLNTASPVQFGNPTVQVDPANGVITQGLDVNLTANTQASTDQYQFTWAASTSPQGPWTAIPGQGKTVNWKPAAPGNYYVQINIVDKNSPQTPYSTVTAAAIVFVSQPDNLVTTTPPGGTIQRGSDIKLHFNAPVGLRPGTYAYAWAYSQSPTGPFTPIVGSNSTDVDWLPTLDGAYYLSVTLANSANGTSYTLVTPTAPVNVSEGQPFVNVSSTTANRGSAVQLSLNIPNPGSGPFTWYYQPTAGGTTSTAAGQTAATAGGWIRIPGTGASTTLYANEVGPYNFRVDVPTPNGVSQLITTNPLLTVTEPTPLITTNPPNETVAPGGSVEIDFNAKDVNTDNFSFLYYVSQNPALGWTVLPAPRTNSADPKKYVWLTSATTTQYGSYYVRVDAARKDGTGSLSFVSSAPVINIQQFSQ